MLSRSLPLYDDNCPKCFLHVVIDASSYSCFVSYYSRYSDDVLGDSWSDNMKVVPVNFKEHKAMLGHCKMILEDDRGKIAINPDKFDKLITALRTAVDNDGTLDKEATPYNDMFDAFRLAMKFYRYEQRTD
jgi:hypothetical protein